MKIKYIKFKVTTSKWKCHKCKKKLLGENGFIHIKCGRDYGYWSGTEHIRICWNCLTKFLEGECKEDRKSRKSRYLKLTKKAIIRNLEK